jgi:Spy/CpxP family protein refolding chaperone
MERALGMQGIRGRWWNNPKLVAELKLSDEQRKAMDGILLAHRENLIDLRANVEKAELVMEPLMRDDHPDETKILAQIDKVAHARAELEKANAGFLLAIRGKLTPEQWKMVQAYRANQGREGGGLRGQGQGGQRQGGQGQGGQYRRQAPPQQPAQPTAGAPAPAQPGC